MSVKEILKYPDPRLKRRSRNLTQLTDQTVELVQDLLDTMYAAPGVGLAAPQLGLCERVIVIDAGRSERERSSPICLVNPEIIVAEGSVTWEEGCLSVMEYTSNVRRYAYVKVRGLDLNENEVEVDSEGLLAVALQHEIDHLDGKLFLDRISKLKRDLYSKRLFKEIKSGKKRAETSQDVMI